MPAKTEKGKEKKKEKKEITAGVIGAMECEISLISERMTERSVREIGAFRFITGRIGGTETVLARCGVGKVNAALLPSSPESPKR